MKKPARELVISVATVLFFVFFLNVQTSMAAECKKDESPRALFEPILHFFDGVASVFGLKTAYATSPDPDNCASDNFYCNGAQPRVTISWQAAPSVYPDPTCQVSFQCYDFVISGGEYGTNYHIPAYSSSIDLTVSPNTNYTWMAADAVYGYAGCVVPATNCSSFCWHLFPDFPPGNFAVAPHGSFTTGNCCTSTCGAWGTTCSASGTVSRECQREDCSHYTETQPCCTSTCGAWSTTCSASGTVSRECQREDCSHYTETQPCNSAPNKPTITSTVLYPCGLPGYDYGAPFIEMAWNYSDPENNPQRSYGIQFSDSSNFTSVLFEINRPSSSQSLRTAMSSGNFVLYGGTRYWRIWVRDDVSMLSSEWSNPASFEMPKHRYPRPNFQCDNDLTCGSSYFSNEKITFSSASVVYSPATLGSYAWTFEDGNPLSGDKKTVDVVFQSSGAKKINLTIRDSDGYSCSKEKTLNLGEGGGGAPCPAVPNSYPADEWDRVWCDKGFVSKLSDTPEEKNLKFDNDWKTGLVEGLRTDNIGFRSGRTISISSAGDYEFTVGSDDGIRVWIDGVLALDKWTDRPYPAKGKEDIFTKNLSAGDHQVRIDYYENGGGARVSFDFKKVGGANKDPEVNGLSDSNLGREEYCGGASPSSKTLSWNFNDPGDTQSAFRLEMTREDGVRYDNDSDDNGSYISTNQGIAAFLINNQNPSFFSSSPSFDSTVSKFIDYGHTYTWKIKVWDSSDAASGWSNSATFSTPAHAYPDASFTSSKENFSVKDEITLSNNPGVSGVNWEWKWSSNRAVSNISGWDSEQKPKVKFLQAGQDYTIDLVVTDKNNSSIFCEGSKTFEYGPLPGWKEAGS